MDNDLDALALALYVTTDDFINAHPHLAPQRPAVGIQPQISDAELLTLAIMETLLGFTSERRWIRFARKRLTTVFPYIPQQSGYNKRQRNLTELMQHIMTHLAATTGLLDDDVWVVDSTPVECGRSRETVKRLRSGRVRGIRLLRLPLTLLLGTAAAPALHPARPAGRLRAHRGEGR